MSGSRQVAASVVAIIAACSAPFSAADDVPLSINRAEDVVGAVQNALENLPSEADVVVNVNAVQTRIDAA